MIASIAGLLVWRCSLSAGRGDGLVTQAARALLRGLDGEAAAFDEAERLLARAASLTDGYPMFALEATRRLRDRHWSDAEPPVQVVFERLAARDLDGAEAAAAALPDGLTGRAELTRFVAELRSARLAGAHPPG